MRRPDPSPFPTVEAAWFWAAQVLNTAAFGPVAPQIGEIVKVLDTLYRSRRIDLQHARIMRLWGLRGIAPSPTRPRERGDFRLWREAMDRLEGPLRARGLVDRPMLQDAAD